MRALLTRVGVEELCASRGVFGEAVLPFFIFSFTKGERKTGSAQMRHGGIWKQIMSLILGEFFDFF